MTITFELLEAIPMLKKKYSFLCCTSDICKNLTTKHEYLGYHPDEPEHVSGVGWYQCNVCGVYRQDVRFSSARKTNILN